MALELSKLSSGGIQLPAIENGSYPARIVGIVDMGRHPATDAKTNEIKKDRLGNVITSPRVQLVFELPTERVELPATDDKEAQTIHRRLYKEMALSKGDNAGLTKVLKALCPNATSVGDLLGKACTVQVGKTSSKKDKVESISALTKGMADPETFIEPFIFDFDEPTAEAFANLPDWIKSKIAEATNYEGSKTQEIADSAESSGDADADAAANAMLG